jgi:hypothetical protein
VERAAEEAVEVAVPEHGLSVRNEPAVVVDVDDDEDFVFVEMGEL